MTMKIMPKGNSEQAVTVRIPSSLIRRIRNIAKQKGVSINRLVNEWLCSTISDK